MVTGGAVVVFVVVGIGTGSGVGFGVGVVTGGWVDWVVGDRVVFVAPVVVTGATVVELIAPDEFEGIVVGKTVGATVVFASIMGGLIVVTLAGLSATRNY